MVPTKIAIGSGVQTRLSWQHPLVRDAAQRRSRAVRSRSVAAPHVAAGPAEADGGAQPGGQDPAPAPEIGGDGGAFRFEQQWWPAAVLDTTDKRRPHAVELLGRPLVLWYDAPAAAWRCQDDVCPHRLAPLSEGRVDHAKGQIECAYHGWRFEGARGACVRIPQAGAEEEARACARCRVATYPTREGADLLFVWATPGDEERAAAAPLPLTQAVVNHVAGGGKVSWYRRLLPYGWDVLLENLSDPSHLPFAHHSANGGLRRDRATPLPFTPVRVAAPGEPARGELGYDGSRPPNVFRHAAPVGVFRYPSISGSGSIALVAVSAPCSVSYYSRNRATEISTELMAVPSGPGRSMAFVGGIAKLQPGAPLATSLLFRLMSARPRWRSCLTTNLVFDQDTVFLQAQDSLLRKKGGGRAWAKSYYMPVTCDRMITALRSWIDGKAGGGPTWPATADPAPAGRPARRQMNDRWSQHTAHCTACLAALAALRRRAAGLAGLAAALALLAVGAAARAGAQQLRAGGGPAALVAGAAVGAALALAAAWRARKLLPQFHYVEYHAADNN